MSSDKIKVIESYKEIVENSKTFNTALKEKDTSIIDLLSSFKQWYYIEEIKDFAPSKFIGYRDMTVSTYLTYHTKSLDGRDTEKTLGKYFRKLERGSEVEILLREKLSNKIDSYNKKLRSNAVISIYKHDKA